MAFGGQSQQRWGDNTVSQNEFIRDIQLTDLSGRVVHTGPARGKGMVLLAFFRTTCPTCQLTLPYLQKLADAYKESGKLTVIGISQDREHETREFAAKYGINFSLVLDRELYHSLIYGIAAVPTVYLVASDGAVARKLVGWNRRIVNDLSVKVAAFAGIETPAVIVEDDDPAPAMRAG